jgi:hypothetical protein
MLTIALSHLLGRGVRLEAHEAVALARALLAHPVGIPTPENILLGSDGSISCTSTAGAPSVVSIACLLHTLLPAGTPNVPAPLRYAIARALEAVEAPPFATPGEFSSALARFEKGATREVLRGVLQRGARPSSPGAAPTTAAAPPTLESAGAAGTRPTVDGSRRWALVAAVVLVASFAASFAIVDGTNRRRAAGTASGGSSVGSGVSPARPAANSSPAAPAHVQPTYEIVRVPPSSVSSREIGPPQGRPDEHAAEAVEAMHVRGAANAFSPAFASDGTAIFFHTGGERDARSAIEVATAGRSGGDRGVTTIVDDGSHNYHARPSPDGRLVAFDSDRDGERGIYVANRDGSQVRRVSGAGFAAVPTWSRNGEWLAYIRREADKPSVWNLWVQPAAGGSARRVTNYRYGQTWAASWFPDTRRIAYSHEDTLMVMDLRTGQATRYRTPVKGHLVRTPAVSPDGTKVVFQVFRQGVWLLDLADRSMHRVLADPNAEEFAWSPDGREIAFHSRRAGQWGIYVLSRS